MTKEQAIKILGTEVAAQAAAAIGEEWGQQEVGQYRDQNEGKPLPAWIMGTYAGTLPALTEKEADAYDLLIDCAARDVWSAS